MELNHDNQILWDFEEEIIVYQIVTLPSWSQRIGIFALEAFMIFDCIFWFVGLLILACVSCGCMILQDTCLISALF